MVSISIHSPRRSPRISDQGLKRQSPRLLARQSTGSRANAADKRQDVENDARVSPTSGKGKGPARRAHSLGGEHLKRAQLSKDKDNTISIVPSRRNVPGPRKSAIRAAPPQIFASPTINDANPIIRSGVSSSDGISAIGGNDLIELMQSIETSRSDSMSEARASRSSSRRNIVEVNQDIMEEQEVDNTIVRKKRRVTFNPYQERNDFDWKEPTISIRPSGETELVTIGSTSSGSRSNESTDMSMSLDSDDSQLQDDEDAEEASMEITAAYDSTCEKNDTLSDDSAMDMTTAMGGVLDTARSIMPSGDEEIDDDSASEDESMNTDSSPRRDNGDQTVTMQFTTIHGVMEDDSITRLLEEEEEQAEDEEVDMQLEEIVATSSTMGGDDDDDDSAMELTETFSPDRTNMTAISSHSIQSTPKSSSTVIPTRPPSPKKGHEFCHIPAAESPKQHLSSATKKAIARRQSLAQSPTKREVKERKSSLGNRLSTSQLKHNSEPASDTNRILTARPSLPASKIPLPTSNMNVKKRPSSPIKAPSTPSKTWQSFRKSNGSASPSKEASDGNQSSNRSAFGSPQRIRVELAEIPTNTMPQEPNATIKDSRVSTERFFSSLGIDFPKLEMPRKRHVRRLSSMKDEGDTMQKVKAACGQVGFLDSLMEACEELKETVEEGSMMLAKMENDFYESPPLYVAEVDAFQDENDRQRAIAAFQLQRSAARANALQAYYAWRAEKQFDDPALAKWKELRDRLQADVHLIQLQKKQLKEEAMPVLQKRHDELLEEIKREKKRQKKIEEGEKQELSELHRAMEEQGAILDEQKSAHDEAVKCLTDIQKQLNGVTEVTTALEEKVDLTKKLCAAHKTYNKEEASMMAKEIEQMSVLHLWRIQSTSAETIIMELEGVVELTMSLQGAIVRGANVQMHNGGLWQGLLQDALTLCISTSHQVASPAAVVRFVTTAWTRLRHVMATIETLRAHYPTAVTILNSPGERKVLIQSSVLSLQHKSKLIIELHCRTNRLFDQRASLFEEADVHARCVYGDLRVTSLHKKLVRSVEEGKDFVDVANLIMQAVG